MTQITSEVLLVSQLFLKGRFTVPWHQRYYDWTVEQVTELLVDLKEALDEDRASYFLGSIMLVAGEEVWEINDGQQRLITLSLLFAAFGRRFAKNREADAGREMLALRLLFDRPENAVSNFDDTTREVPRVEPPRQDRSVPQECLVSAYLSLVGDPTNMPWQTACQRLNAVPWAITPNNMAQVWQNVLWAGGTDGKIITKNRQISSRLVAYMAGEKLTEEQLDGLLNDYRTLFPEDQRPGKMLPERVTDE